MHYEYHARTIYIARSRALSRKLTLKDRPLPVVFLKNRNHFGWWLITKSLNESFFGLGQVGKNDQVLDSDPKINPHPLLYIWGYFSSFLNPENVTTGTIKKVSKVSYLSLVFFHCMTHLSYFILTHVSVKKNKFCHQFFWIPFFNSRIVSFWMFFVTWLSFTQGVFNWRATPTHSTLIGWTEWQWMRTNSDWPIRRINFKYSMK